MAIRPDYDIGTVTLTSGSSDFTTSGSSLQTAAVQAGDAIIAPSGHVLIIASITGQNSGTLFLPCPPDAAGTGLPLRIRFQPDGSRYQGAVRDLVERLANGILENIAAIPVQDGKTLVGNAAGQYEPRDYIADTNGNLAELAALTLAANKFLNTNASGDLIQSDITGLGRNLLDDATGAAMFATMGATELINQNGYLVFPNGIIMQWGLITTFNASGGASVTFPMAFPSGHWCIQATLRGAYNAGHLYAGYIDWTNASSTGFFLYGRRITPSGIEIVTSNANAYWIAIGRK